MSHLLTLFPMAPADAQTPPVPARGAWTLADDLFVAGLPEDVRAFVGRVQSDDGVSYERGREDGYEAGKESRADESYDTGHQNGRDEGREAARADVRAAVRRCFRELIAAKDAEEMIDALDETIDEIRRAA